MSTMHIMVDCEFFDMYLFDKLIANITTAHV
jgi:hypothetical protein